MAGQPAVMAPTEVVASGPVARLAAAGAVVVLAIAVLFLPDVRTTTLPSGSAVLASGAVEFLDGESWQPIRIGETVPHDVPLRAREDGAVLDVRDGQLELTSGARLTLSAWHVDLERGSILVVAPARWSVDAEGVTSSGNGAWRVDGGIAGRLAVYEGGARAEAQNRDLKVPALFETGIIDGDLDTVASPMRYLATDPWDRRFLADAIAIDRVVEQLQNGWRAQYDDVSQQVVFYDDFVSGLADADTAGVGDAVELLAPRRELDRFGPPVDVLTGLVFARARVGITGDTLATAASEIVGLRRSGATWGLTATLLGLDRDAINAAAEAGLTERQDAVDAGTAEPPITAEPDPEPPPEPEPTPDPTPPPPDPTPDPDPPDPDDDDDGDVVDSLGNIVDDLGGLLGEDSDPDDSDTIPGTLGDVIDEVGSVLDDATDALLGFG